MYKRYASILDLSKIDKNFDIHGCDFGHSNHSHMHNIIFYLDTNTDTSEVHFCAYVCCDGHINGVLDDVSYVIVTNRYIMKIFNSLCKKYDLEIRHVTNIRAYDLYPFLLK